jgi:hypothetical protein
MLLHELVRLQETVERKRDRQRLRMSARRLRAELRERNRVEHALMEMRWARLC